MNALAARLDGIAGVNTFTLDPTRIIDKSDGVSIILEMAEKDGIDNTNHSCRIRSEMPVIISIFVPRLLTVNPSIPGDKSSIPVWQLVDPFYQEVNFRMMGSQSARQFNGLALDTVPVTRQSKSDDTMTVMRVVYAITYETYHADVTA
jgi:hypothetical protein